MVHFYNIKLHPVSGIKLMNFGYYLLHFIYIDRWDIITILSAPFLLLYALCKN